MKITVIGGGSTYTPELVDGFARKAAALSLDEICLMDIDPVRLDTVAGFCERILRAGDFPVRLVRTSDLETAVAGSSYVITQLRVGMNAARREDEYLGRRHGLVGQETTGVGGCAKALRTIPVILRIAGVMRQHAPGALLANFTNPAGLVTEALTRHAPDVPSVGVCNVGITTKMGMLETLEPELGSIDPGETFLDTLGLNHLTWHRGFKVGEVEYWEQVFARYLQDLKEADEPEWDAALIETLGMIPNYYLHYFYETNQVVADQQEWPPSRAETVIEIEKELLAQYADPQLHSLPADLMKRGGAYYSTLAAQLVDSHHNDLAQVHVVNMPNRGAVPGMPDDWVLELPCRVDHSGITPLPAEPLPQVCFGLVAQVKMYELLTVEAAVNGDRDALYKALLAHPLGPDASKVEAVMQDLLVTHRRYLPQFFS